MRILVTGAAGFIGFHVCRRLVEQPGRATVLGLDNLNDYYDPALKQARLELLDDAPDFRFMKADIADPTVLPGLFATFRPDYVLHLAAQANVRDSVRNPAPYADANLCGFFHLLEACRAHPPRHAVFASSSSVYGANARTPFDEEADTSRPLSFYGATKKANEVMAHSYAHLHGLNLTGLRLFDVYGPWGRPDTAPSLFTRALCEGRPIDLFDGGRYRRDFTYIDDVVDGVLKVLLYHPAERPTPPFRLFNLGHHRPVELLLFVRMLEQLVGRPAKLNLLPPQPSDVPETFAGIARIKAAVRWEPRVALEEGLGNFVGWFRKFYQV
jgi:UDP-glucuronate 4-epimerase